MDNLKKAIIMIGSIAAFVAIFAGIAIFTKDDDSSADASPSPSIDVEYVNGNKSGTIGAPADMSGYRFLDQNEPDGFVNASLETANDMITSGTGMIYVGDTDCKWCQRAVPVLNKLANDEHIYINYVDLEKEDSTGSDFKVFKALTNDWLDKDDEGNRVVMTPFVLVIKNGVIVNTHIGLVSDFEITDESSNLNSEQFNELYDIYKKMLMQISGGD